MSTVSILGMAVKFLIYRDAKTKSWKSEGFDLKSEFGIQISLKI